MEIDLDRLILELPDVSEADGRRLALLVAEALGSVETPGGTLAADRLRVSLSLHPGDSLPSTAQRIAQEIRAAVVRSSS